MNSALLYLPYLPSVSWWFTFMGNKDILIEKEENFVKATDRNRCSICGANGKMLLTVPVEGGREKKQLYKDVKLHHSSGWQHQHWQSILSAYGSAPFFEHYEVKLRPFYEREYKFLFDLNLSLLESITNWLRIEKKFAFTTFYEKHPAGMTDLRASTQPYSNQPRYYQVFEEKHGFVSGLSIIDLLFHLGPEAKNYLQAGVK